MKRLESTADVLAFRSGRYLAVSQPSGCDTSSNRAVLRGFAGVKTLDHNAGKVSRYGVGESGRYIFPTNERSSRRPLRRVSGSGWRAEFSQNLFPIAFSQNAASEMEKRDDRASPARTIVGSHDDRLSEMSGTASRRSIGSSCRIRIFASLQGNGDIWSTRAP